jgi:NhaP-type Na+/H+ or K+/H+ antiporter
VAPACSAICITAGWFGPKGFASVLYGLLLVQAATPGADRLFHLVAIVVVGSMVAHFSTDVRPLGSRPLRKTDPSHRVFHRKAMAEMAPA